MFLRLKLNLATVFVLSAAVIFLSLFAHNLMHKKFTELSQETLSVHRQSVVETVSAEIHRLHEQGIQFAKSYEESKQTLKGTPFQFFAKLETGNQQSWKVSTLENLDADGSFQFDRAQLTQKIYRFFPASDLQKKSRTIKRFAWAGEEMIGVAIPFEVAIVGSPQVNSTAVYLFALPVVQWQRSLQMFKRKDLDSFLMTTNGRLVLAQGIDQNDEVSQRGDVSQILQERKRIGSAQFVDDKKNNRISVFEKVPESNLYVVVSKADKSEWVLADFGLMALLVLICALVSLLILVSGAVSPVVNGVNEVEELLSRFAKGETQTPLPAELPGVSVNFVQYLKKIQNRLLERPAPSQSVEMQPAVQAQKTIEVKEVIKSDPIIKDLVAPLNAILGFAKKGRITRGSPQTKEIFESIVEEAEAVCNKISGTKKQDESQELKKESCDLLKITNTAISQAGQNIKSHGVVLRKDLNSVPSIPGVAIRLQAAIDECLRNAVKYAGSGRKKEVLLSLAPQGANIVLSFTDYGEHDPLSETDGEKIIDAGLIGISGILAVHNGAMTVDYSEKGQRTLNVLIPFKGKSVEVKSQVVLSKSGHSMPKLKKAAESVDMPAMPSEQNDFEEDGLAETEEYHVDEIRGVKKS